MPLPQKVIEQLGREPARTPGWSVKLLMVSSVIFMLALGAYVGVEFGYEKYLQNQLDALDEQITKASASVSSADVDTVRKFYSQLTNVKMLLDQHIAMSRLFTWLETNTLQQVTWSDLALRQGTNEIQMNGRAVAMNDYVNELQHLEAQPEVQKVTSQNVRFDDTSGAWDFDVRVVFRQGFFVAALGATNGGAPTNTPASP